jgi:hypothetical protein
MEFKIGAVAVAIIFFTTFVVVKSKAKNDRFKGLRIISYGLPFAAIGLLFAEFGKINLGVVLVATAFPLYLIGAAIHLKIMMGKFVPKTTECDKDQEDKETTSDAMVTSHSYKGIQLWIRHAFESTSRISASPAGPRRMESDASKQLARYRCRHRRCWWLRGENC